MKTNLSRYKGQVLVQVIVIGTIATLMIGGLVGWAGVNIKLSRQALDRERSIQLAEAGIEYYRWHLAHAPTDYTDNTGLPGPYIHSVLDKDGTVLGTFSLSITPPPTGSTKVVIASTGKTSTSSPIARTIQVEMAIPSLAKFAVVANDNMRFGEGTEVFGPIHSNRGIRFDGLAHNVVSSALATYDDPDHSGSTEFGVHTHLNPPPSSGSNDTFRSAEAPPSAVPLRLDVFEAGRQFPVPATDFTGLTNDLSQMKSNAQTSGRYFAPSGSQGYQIILKTNDTFDVYRVTSQISPSSKCTNVYSQAGWGTWSVSNRTLVGNYAIPANGLVFVEDNVWVEGAINTARVTIAAGRFPDNASNRPNIIVNKNILYTNYDGSDVIALISQGHIHVGLVSDDMLRIDAALIAQNGRVGRFYYVGPGNNFCTPYHTRSSITLYGMIATNQRYGFAYTDGNGYDIRNIIYDANLLYSPPPSFPLTSDQYEVLSWEEL
jgi:hypothetical protein